MAAIENVYDLWVEGYQKIEKLHGEKTAQQFKIDANDIVPANAFSTPFLCKQITSLIASYVEE